MPPSSSHSDIGEWKVGIQELIRLWRGLEPAEASRRDRHRQRHRQLAERSREVQRLKNKRLVSMFLHRRKIESFLRYKSVKNKVPVVDDPRPQSAPHELDQIKRAISFSSLREIFSNPLRQISDHQRDQQVLTHERDLQVGEYWSSAAGTTMSTEHLQERSTRRSDLSWEEPAAESLEMSKIDDDSSVLHGWQQVDDDQYSMMNRELFSTDNSEIIQLLERRTVSTSLASGFQEKLSKAILSSLQRHHQRTPEEEEANDGRRHSHHESQTDAHALVKLRSDIANLHNEMSELRKLLVGYMESSSSQWEAVNKGSCCVCNHKQIDSLVYRCGHMCTCFKCGNHLKTNTGKCPVCATPIVDVVRAHTLPTYSDPN